MAAWIWLVLGLGLMVLELLAPGSFFMLILGLAGLTVGALGLLGLSESLLPQTAIFSVTAVLLWIGLGKRLRSVSRQRKNEPGQLVGKRVVVQGDLAPATHGSGELFGSPWRLLNVGEMMIADGAEAEVVGEEGVTLRVRAIK
jgi:membrane protein implicated in regulation of membrane protease activity